MAEDEATIWIRKNGIGHAFSRELGCCCRRCRTINYTLIPPPSHLAPFPGWDDPPWRAHTSASILVGDQSDKVQGHLLVDCGAGVVDSLVCSGLDLLDSIAALLITHWHPDHVLAINQLAESLRRSAKRRKRAFRKLSVYCTLATYDWLRSKSGLDYEFKTLLRFCEVLPEDSFGVCIGSLEFQFVPLPVAHGSIEGAVIYVAEHQSKKVVFGWDIDIPSAQIPHDGRTNEEIVRTYLDDYRPQMLFMASNTKKATGTGHTSYELAQTYINIIQPGEVFLTHLSGHEDNVGAEGYGWTDADWERAVDSDGARVARQGMMIKL